MLLLEAHKRRVLSRPPQTHLPAQDPHDGPRPTMRRVPLPELPLPPTLIFKRANSRMAHLSVPPPTFASLLPPVSSSLPLPFFSTCIPRPPSRGRSAAETQTGHPTRTRRPISSAPVLSDPSTPPEPAPEQHLLATGPQASAGVDAWFRLCGGGARRERGSGVREAPSRARFRPDPTQVSSSAGLSSGIPRGGVISADVVRVVV